jgi:hypothetical protein
MELKTAIVSGIVPYINHDNGELGGNFLPNANAYPGFSVAKYATQASDQINQVMFTFAQKSVGDYRAATTANITLSGLQTIDGVSLIAGDKVLVKNQTTTSQNGFYIVDEAAWEREEGYLIYNNAIAKVAEGTVSANLWAIAVTPDPYTQGTSTLSFVMRPAFNTLVEVNKSYYLRFKNFGNIPGYYANSTPLSVANVATTANITLSGLQTVDGVSLIAGDKVLVKNQTTTSQNGLYTVASGVWVKAVIGGGVIARFVGIVSSGTYAQRNVIIDYSGTVPIHVMGSIILYSTFADAVAESNPVIPVATSVTLNWVVKKYTAFPCRHYGAAELEDIVCCPPIAIATDFKPLAATVTLDPGYDVEVTMNSDGYGFTAVNRDYYLAQNWLWGERDGNEYRLTISTLSAAGRTISFFDVASMGDSYDSGVISDEDIQDPIILTNSIGSTYTVTLHTPIALPSIINLVMTGASFLGNSNVVSSVNPFIDLGTITESMTYDADTGYYFSAVKNYFNIPGRLHFHSRFFRAGSENISGFTNANAIYFNYNDYETGLFSYAVGNLKLNTSGQVYVDYSFSGALPVVYMAYSQTSTAIKQLPAGLPYSFYNKSSWLIKSANVTLSGTGP